MESRYKKYKETYKKYRENNKDKIKEINKKWYKKSKDKVKKYRLENKEKHKKYQREWIFDKHFGGLRNKVLIRDKFKCVKCGITQEEHLKEYKRQLSIHHVDRKGRNVNNPNNSMKNLITLCLSCHYKEHCHEDRSKLE